MAEGERRLRVICEPGLVNERTPCDQRAEIGVFGDKEEVLSLGSLAHTLAPGGMIAS